MQTQSIEFPNPMIAIIVIQFTIHLLTITITHTQTQTHTHTHILVAVGVTRGIRGYMKLIPHRLPRPHRSQIVLQLS